MGTKSIVKTPIVESAVDITEKWVQSRLTDPRFATDTLYSGTIDSGTASRTNSLRSNNPSLRLEPAQPRFESPMLEAAPPRTPSSVHRSSMYIEPSQEAGTVI